MDETVHVVSEYPADGSWGPRSETEAVLARHEVNENGLLTGGPLTEADWREWRRLFDAGQIGRWRNKT